MWLIGVHRILQVQDYVGEVCTSWSLRKEQNWQRVMHGVDLFLSVLSGLAQHEVSGSLLGSATDPSHDLGPDP